MRAYIYAHGRKRGGASETKENSADERRINELLTPGIARYLGQYRPVLARTKNPTLLVDLIANANLLPSSVSKLPPLAGSSIPGIFGSRPFSNHMPGNRISGRTHSPSGWFADGPPAMSTLAVG